MAWSTRIAATTEVPKVAQEVAAPVERMPADTPRRAATAAPMRSAVADQRDVCRAGKPGSQFANQS